jgi:hypothetical protein
MKMTPLKAIHQHCVNCIVDPQPGNGTKHEQTEACTSYQCALYELRQITSREKSRRSDEKLKAMSREELGAYEAKKALKTKRLIENLGRPKV